MACGISCSELEKGWNLQGWSTKRTHGLGVLFFGIWIFKGCDTWNHTGYGLRFPKTNLETSVEYLQRHFFNHPACLFLEQITDRYIELLFWVLRYSVHCHGLELLQEPPQNKICYSLHQKYTSFPCFPITCSSAIWKSFFFGKQELLTPFLISWRKLTKCYYKLLPKTSATWWLFSCTFILLFKVEILKYPKRFMWYYVNFEYIAKM